MCFAPQRSALFGHLNFQKWGVFCTFWLWNLFRGAHFDFETCFAPQRRAHFRHVSFQKWSENGVFWTCWLPNVLRATTPCNFSPLISLDGSAPAASWKSTVFCGCSTFSRTLIFFLLTLSSLTLPTSAFPSVHIVGSLTSKPPSVTYV